MNEHGRRVARFERKVRADLQARCWLRWHSFLLGTLCFLTAWGLSAGLMRSGVDVLVLRWPLALAGAYIVFIGLLWLWCRWLLLREQGDADLGLDSGIDIDFSGGSASGSFDAEAGLEHAGDAAEAALGAAASADEGIVVAVPLAVVVGVAVLIASALSIAVFGLFGVEVLLGVAVEIALASAGGALAYRARREGWLAHALTRTIWPMAALLVTVVLLGAVIDHWLPQAHSLPQALRLLRA
jgi:hypothetical protein